jgi:GTP-binding protein
MVKAFRMEHVLTELHREIPFAAHCPTLFISAQQGRNVGKILPMMEATFAERKKRITTGVLNQFVDACIRKLHPPMLQGKRLRIYYMTQVETSPPRFIVFINKREWLAGSYEKYLVNQFRETFGFGGTPLQFEFRERERRP